MTKYSFADLDKWARKMERRQDAILRQSTNDLLKGIDIRAGLTRGGTFKRGVIPRDLGALAGSLQSTLLGSTAISGTGENSYVMVIGELKGGDRVRFVWGGANAPYAPAIHYGFDSYPGTFWRDDAAGKWRRYVKAATARAKATIR